MSRRHLLITGVVLLGTALAGSQAWLPLVPAQTPGSDPLLPAEVPPQPVKSTRPPWLDTVATPLPASADAPWTPEVIATARPVSSSPPEKAPASIPPRPLSNLPLIATSSSRSGESANVTPGRRRCPASPSGRTTAPSTLSCSGPWPEGPGHPGRSASGPCRIRTNRTGGHGSWPSSDRRPETAKSGSGIGHAGQAAGL